MSKLPDFSNVGIVDNFRYWLIKKIAGKHAIVLNVKIDIVPRDDDPNHAATIADLDGGYVSRVTFPDYGESVIQLSGRSKQ